MSTKQQPMSNDSAKLEMTLTPDMVAMFKREPFFLEIEMLQGQREEMADGQIKFTLEIHDMDKALMVKEFVLKLISNSTNTCQN